MIKHYVTRPSSSNETILSELDKKSELIIDSGCEIISINLNTNGSKWIGTIFYRVPKNTKFSLR